MNTNHYLSFVLLIFLSIAIVACNADLFHPEDPFLICKAGDFSCEYEHNIPGFVTIAKGSERQHFILTENGLKKSKIEEGEPLAYNPKNNLALVKETTDSGIEISIINAETGKDVSSEIKIPKFEKEHKEENEEFSKLTDPSVSSACLTDNGTAVLLVTYEQLYNYSKELNFIFVYEKGEAKNAKKYAFRNPMNFDDTTGEEDEIPGWSEDSPLEIQCGKDGSIYLLTAKIRRSDFALKSFRPVYNLDRVNLKTGKTEFTNIAFIAFDRLHSSYYSEKEKKIYNFLNDTESNEKAILRILEPGEYEIPEVPVEKEDGSLLFSETPDGKVLVFFVKNRKNSEEEQRLELLDL